MGYQPFDAHGDAYDRLAKRFRANRAENVVLRAEVAALRRELSGYRLAMPVEVIAPADGIVSMVAEERKVSPQAVMSGDKSRPTAWARFIAYHEIRESLGWSLLQIGAYFNRDHTTILEGLRRYGELLASGRIKRETGN